MTGRQQQNDLDYMREEVEGRCEELVSELLGEPTSTGRQEWRWGSHGKFALQVSGDRRGLWYDFSTGEGGDIIDLVRREYGLSYGDVFEWIRGRLALPSIERRRPEARPSTERSLAERIDSAHQLYSNARQAGGHGKAYFAARGLDYPEPLGRQLRYSEDVFFKNLWGPHQALLMPVRDRADYRICGVHKIGLAGNANLRRNDGSKIKTSAGRILGAAMMLGRPDGHLAICEGLETAVGIMMRDPGLVVWALCGASFMAAFEPIDGIGHLTIHADNDASGAGERAARDCARLWEEHADVTILTPAATGTDFADLQRRGSWAKTTV